MVHYDHIVIEQGFGHALEDADNSESSGRDRHRGL